MLKRIGAEESGEFKAVASGTLPSGKPVLVNADGTVSTPASAIVDTTIFNNADTDSISAVFDSNSNKIVIAYRDKGNSNHGTAIVGTVSGTSITFGSEVVFESATVNYISASFDSSNNKVIIAYRDEGNSNYGTAIVGTVSGTGISFGSAATFNSGTTIYVDSTFDSNSNKVVIVYRDHGNSNYGTAIVGTVSGTSISFGSEAVFSSVQTDFIKCSFDNNANKVAIIYEISSSGRAKVGTVSGTSISFGSEATFTSNNVNSQAISFDTTANKFAIFYKDVTNSNDGRCRVGTISGTSISFGTEAVFYTDDSVNNLNSVYNPDANVTSVVYTDGSGGVGTLQNGTISGTDISFGAQQSFRDGGSVDYGLSFGITYDTNSDLTCIAFGSAAAAQIGTAALYSSTASVLTSENYIGMSSGAAFQTGSAATLGSPTVFESAETAYFGAAFDSNSNRVVFSYQDSGNSNYGTAIVGTISGTSISFGTPVVFESATTTRTAVAFDSNLNKIVIAYQDGGNSSHGTAIVGTVASGDNSISFGSAAVFSSTSTEEINIVFDTNSNKFVISYKASSEGKAIVATVSGTSISFGSEATFAAYSLSGISSAFDSNSNKVLLSYKFPTYNNEAGKARVGTVSGTSISFGTEATFVTADLGITLAIFDASQNKFVVIWGVGSSSYAVVATISGTDVSFGATLTLSDDADQYYSGHYDSAAQKCIFVYHDNNDDGAYTSFTISGTTATQGEVVIFESTTMAYAASTFDSSAEKSVVAYKANYGATGYGTAVVFSADSRATTRGEVADGGNASMDIIGSVSDNQIGLTAGQQYFVQTDGTISTTAGSPSVLAGTAISATELVVKT